MKSSSISLVGCFRRENDDDFLSMVLIQIQYRSSWKSPCYGAHRSNKQEKGGLGTRVCDVDLCHPIMFHDPHSAAVFFLLGQSERTRTHRLHSHSSHNYTQPTLYTHTHTLLSYWGEYTSSPSSPQPLEKFHYATQAILSNSDPHGPHHFPHRVFWPIPLAIVSV